MDYIKNADKSIGKYTNFVGRGFFKKKKKIYLRNPIFQIYRYIYIQNLIVVIINFFEIFFLQIENKTRKNIKGNRFDSRIPIRKRLDITPKGSKRMEREKE